MITSQLWGANGELFNPAGRLPDVSYAGYQNGAANPPNVSQVINAATQYGATGNDTSDDSIAIQRALDAANNGAVFLPAGTYYLDRPVQINTSNVVLHGAGSTSTILRPRVPLDTLLDVSGRDANYGWTAYVEIAGANLPGTPRWPTDRENLNTRLGTKITNVTAAASRGDKALMVASTAGLAAGQEIRLRMHNPADNSLGCELHDDLACLDAEGQGWFGRQDVDWVVKITSIVGNMIQLERPLRLDVRTVWTP
jgi:Pectate lyase superfamily protein